MKTATNRTWAKTSSITASISPSPKIVAGGGIINLPETDAAGNPVYLVDEFGELLLDWKGDPQLAYENARRVRFITQPKSKAGPRRRFWWRSTARVKKAAASRRTFSCGAWLLLDQRQPLCL